MADFRLCQNQVSLPNTIAGFSVCQCDCLLAAGWLVGFRCDFTFSPRLELTAESGADLRSHQGASLAVLGPTAPFLRARYALRPGR